VLRFDLSAFRRLSDKSAIDPQKSTSFCEV